MSRITNRADQIVGSLLGKQGELIDWLSKGERKDNRLLDAIDMLAFKCVDCGIWYDVDQMDEDGKCPDCSEGVEG